MNNQKQAPRGKSFWPVLGFLLALSAGTLAFIFAPSVLDAVKRSLPNFPPITPTVTLIMTGILFILFALVFSLIVAFAVPRRKSGVTEIQMTKDRKAMVNAKMARKIKQREINRQGKAR